MVIPLTCACHAYETHCACCICTAFSYVPPFLSIHDVNRPANLVMIILYLDETSQFYDQNKYQFSFFLFSCTIELHVISEMHSTDQYPLLMWWITYVICILLQVTFLFCSWPASRSSSQVWYFYFLNILLKILS